MKGMVQMFKADDKRYEYLPMRRVGSTGLVLPVISLGLWRNFDSNSPYYERKQLILHAFNRGVFSFDCADRYGKPEVGSAESLLGNILKDELQPYRDELVITTKVGYETGPGPYGQMLSRKSILQSIDRSLERLQTDYVDIYYAHRFDSKTDLFESVQALDQVVRQGKALYIGISNFDNKQTKEAIRLFKELGTPFTVNQVSYNMLNTTIENDGLLDTLRKEHRGLVAYGPLAEGLLSSRYLKEIPADFPIHHTSKKVFDKGEKNILLKLNALNEIAQKRNQTLSQLALSWLLAEEVVSSVIIGTTSEAHLDDNLEAAKNMTFTENEKIEIRKITDLFN
ncbi:aldo keto reductase [Liquorilactobacillus mali KCTC 3596 = DSM 20444]|uniref:Aldo keto reductase n=2 Tax=Liquorilactobacillus mali TaxID=1618 RepID=A0A0R2EBF0_9LACO|nr:aldo keto reductase [Liquorilactobacillus mali KCTC 3596 = DSM 20444]